jgi:hypothetical protein
MREINVRYNTGPPSEPCSEEDKNASRRDEKQVTDDAWSVYAIIRLHCR